MALPSAERRSLIEWEHAAISIARQCRLLGLALSTLYYEGRGTSAGNLALMRRIDEQYMKTPWYGAPRMTHCLREYYTQYNTQRPHQALGYHRPADVHFGRYYGIISYQPTKEWPCPPHCTTGTAAHNSMVVMAAASTLKVRFRCPNNGVKRSLSKTQRLGNEIFLK